MSTERTGFDAMAKILDQMDDDELHAILVVVMMILKRRMMIVVMMMVKTKWGKLW